MPETNTYTEVMKRISSRFGIDSQLVNIALSDRTDRVEDQQIGYTVDGALSSIGFGKFQYLVLAYAGLGLVAESMEMTLLSFVGPAIQPEWGISQGKQSLLSSVTLFGMLVGASSWGVFSDSYGRKKGFLGAAIIATASGLLSAFTPNYILLLILRCLSGIGLGCGHVFISWYVEFVPTPNRGTYMAVFSSFWTLGSILEASLAWWIMPRYGWRWLVGLSAVPYLAALLFYPFVPESPRFLSTQKRFLEAHNILTKGAKLNKKELTGEVTKSTELPSSKSNESIFLTMVKLIKPPWMRTTLLLWALYLANTFSYYGIVLLASQLSIQQKECHKSTLQAENILYDRYYKNVLINSFADLPGLVLSAFILDRIGRKVFMEIMIIGGFILLLPLVVHQNAIMTTLFLFGARMFISASFATVCIYAPEIYPTNLRATGVGIAMAIARFGAIACPMIVTAKMGGGCKQTIPVIVFEVSVLAQGLSAVFLPLETSGRALRDNIDSPHQPLLE